MLNDISFNDVAIVYAKENDYRSYFWWMGKVETIDLLRNTNLAEKSGTL